MPVTGAIVATVAPRRIVQVAFVPFGGLLALLSVAGSAWELFVILLGWGAALGTIDVAMNTEAAALQDRLGRLVMSRFHASYSVGGLVGAGTGALAAATGVSVTVNFVVAGVVVAVIGATAGEAFSVAGGRPEPASTATAEQMDGERQRQVRRPQFSWVLVALSAIAFSAGSTRSG